MQGIDDLFGFEQRSPSHQHALDLIPAPWISEFPTASGLCGGKKSHLDDVWVTWAASIIGGLQGVSILELGPCECYHTHRFQMAGAGAITSIEPQRLNFLKCLIIKNIFNLHAQILLGSFLPFVKYTSTKYDLCWLGNTLHRAKSPLELLRAVSGVSDTLFIRTHYFDSRILSAGFNLVHFDCNRSIEETFDGRKIVLHHRNDELSSVTGSSKATNYSYWLEKDDLIWVLKSLGFKEIAVGSDNIHHPSGPAIYLLARRIIHSDRSSG